MTDRLHTLTVVLERDTRTDDAEKLIAAIGQMRGVLMVSGVVCDMDVLTHIAQERARREQGEKLWAVLFPTTEATETALWSRDIHEQ